MRQFDLAILGGGPAGYVAAIRAAKMSNASIVLIEKEHMGGTCLNWGCIPTKTLLASSDVLRKVRHADEFGIVVKDVEIDFAKMIARKNRVVTQIRTSLDKLVAAHRITILRGHGKFVAPQQIKVIGQDNALLHAKKTIIATGSLPRNMEAFPFDHHQILSSSSLLDLQELPQSLVIIGGGVIGCELASLYQELGCRVTMLEAMDRILSLEAKELSNALRTAFVQRGITIHTNVNVSKIITTAAGITVVTAAAEQFVAEKALVAVGRKLNTDHIDLQRAGVVVNAQGVIPVNKQMETNVTGIYAIGDITGMMMLAHVASHQGIVAADNATGHAATMHYNAIPSVIFTYPEAASVGMSLEKAQAEGYQAKIGKFPFHALGKAQASGETTGFAQIVIDTKTHQILGAQVMGYGSSLLIASMGLAITNELTVESITETVHAHPTEAEAWLEAALMTQEQAIHLPPKK